MSRKTDPLRGERRRVGYYNSSGEQIFLLTQKDDEFFLYRQNGGGEEMTFTRLEKAKSPITLEEKFHVHEEMRK